MKKISVEVQQDLVEKLSKASPVQAISELVWNSFDADAKKVEVSMEYDNLDTLSKINIKDDGLGIPYLEAEELFKKLGGSWKNNTIKTKKEGRYLHGKEGRGRFKAFALGRVVKWKVVYHKGKELWEYDITIIREKIKEAIISDEFLSSDKESGVWVEITELERNFRSLELNNAIQALTENFAIYLKGYRNIDFRYEGHKIDPEPLIENTHSLGLSEIEDEFAAKHQAQLEIIEWKTPTKKTLYLCNEKGFPLLPLEDRRFHTGNFNFSAYLKSPYVEQLFGNNMLDMEGMNPGLAGSIDEAQQAIRAYFLDRAAQEAKSVVDSWKEEKVYPFEAEPQNTIEKVERQVFDIVAVNINENLPDFSSVPSKTKKLNLSLLKQSIEKSPEDLQLILNEVLNLPKRKQKELAELLQDTTLSAIINAAKLVSDRLKFITSLEEIVFDVELKKCLKERSQLHQILADNTWIFGEEFNLSVSDQSLTAVLKKHVKLLGDDVAIDKPVKRLDGTIGIIDLMLSQRIPTSRGEELDHLIVELKAPKRLLTFEETGQIKSYAFAVSGDERFKNLNTRWNFLLISNDMDGNVEKDVRQGNRPEGILHQSKPGENPAITIWVKTWSQIIQENKARLKFIKERLEYQADRGKALEALQKTYSHLLEGTDVGIKIDKKINNGNVKIA